MKKATLVKVNGYANLGRGVLERNLMDCLTCQMDFNEALEMVEEATYEELVAMAVKYLAD